MESYSLENQRLLITTVRRGAELVRIYDKEKDREVLWNGDPAVWNRCSPILFPLVGRCYGKEYRVDGKAYEAKPHGFARDMDFELLENSLGEDQVWYRLVSTEDTRKEYPFDFSLEAGFSLKENKIQVMWKVLNTGEKTMYFSIGGHPAFRTPEGMKQTQVYLGFEEKKELPYINVELSSGCALCQEVKTLKLEDGYARIKEDSFAQDAFIFENGVVQKVSLCREDKSPYVTLTCQGFPMIGIWSKSSDCPFICLEPWYGRCDNFGFTGEMKDKPGMISLEAGKEFHASYEIIVC